MKKLLILFLLASNFSFSQDLSVLKEKNGFRNIKLNSLVKNYKDFTETHNSDEYITLDDNTFIVGLSKNKYELKTRYNTQINIAGSEVRNITLSTIDGKIFEIFVDIKYSSNVLDNLKLAFGKPNKSYVQDYAEVDYGTTPDEKYTWEIDNVHCTLSNGNLYNGGDTNDVYHLRYVDIKLKELYVLRSKKNSLKKNKDKQKKATSEF
ncbi:hypothetical protein [Lutibacter flavus]|uniref:Uncharacterized protein n=1 Tax=Lutibacter flavus TaxID=691689 RepID=A0A238VIK6_9FLAO|nr:hypothetical protein [Lutibacter flavus]SNR34011.1 hypothetical protein SAMN04488111_0537 [Lutibacter flavus]